MVADLEPVVLTGIVATEELQGLTRDVDVIEGDLSQWEMLEPRGIQTYQVAPGIFRLARSRGITVTTVDTIIAAIALENEASVFSLDKDFASIARLSRLGLYRLKQLI